MLRPPDVEILTWANEHAFVLITNDLDFSAILAASGGASPSVVQIRTQDLLSEAILLEPDGDQLKITLKGDLAGMLNAARDSKRSPDTGDLLVQIKLVAGACSRRYLRLWSVAA